MPKPVDIYYWTTPNGHKITIACEEMGVPYEIKPINIGRGDQFAPEFLAISPNNRIPAIVDPEGPDGEPISLFESGAILQYLGRKTGLFYPKDERGRAEVDQWVFWQAANLGPMTGQWGHFHSYAPAMLPDQRHVAYGAARYGNEVNRLFGVLDRRLRGRAFVAGDYSIADMIIWPWIAPLSNAAFDFTAFPDLTAWRDRVGARAAVGRAMSLGHAFTSVSLVGGSEETRQAQRILFGRGQRR